MLQLLPLVVMILNTVKTGRKAIPAFNVFHVISILQWRWIFLGKAAIAVTLTALDHILQVDKC